MEPQESSLQQIQKLELKEEEEVKGEQQNMSKEGEDEVVSREQEENKEQEEAEQKERLKLKKEQQIFKSSSIPQDEELRKYLQGLLAGDNFNKYCVDCHHKQSTHALLAYGIFVCQDCAKDHARIFKGRSYSIVKDIFNEHWDDYQLESIAPGVAGNRLFFNYLQNYENLATLPIEKKYSSIQVDWYVKRLTAHLDQKPFNEIPPARDWNESFARAKQSMKSLIKRGDKKPAANPDQPLLPNDIPVDQQEKIAQSQPQAEEAHSSDPQASQSKWKSKLKGFFKEKFTKSTPSTASQVKRNLFFESSTIRDRIRDETKYEEEEGDNNIEHFQKAKNQDEVVSDAIFDEAVVSTPRTNKRSNHQYFDEAEPDQDQEEEEAMSIISNQQSYRRRQENFQIQERISESEGFMIRRPQRRLFLEQLNGLLPEEEDQGSIPFPIANHQDNNSQGGGTAPMDYSQNKFGSAIEDHNHSYIQGKGYDEEIEQMRLPMGNFQTVKACPLTPIQNQGIFEGFSKANHITYSPTPQPTNTQFQIYKTLPEFGFSSKIFSGGKKKNKGHIPTTPAKKNFKKFSASKISNFCPAPLPINLSLRQVGLSSNNNRSGTKNQSHYQEEYDIYSPVAHLLRFQETKDTRGEIQMKFDVMSLRKQNRLNTDFEIVCKLGEGTFGEAYKVKQRIDGRMYAVKKAKERYMGFKDREAKLSEVYKALKITSNLSMMSPIPKQIEDMEDEEDKELFKSYCVKVYEAWEENGYLYIQSELCEKGNLNEYLLELTGRGENRNSEFSNTTQEWWQIITEDQVWKFMFEMTCALKHVHDSGFIHLDVKPTNFFVRQCGSVALGDFGQALELSKIRSLKDDDVEGDSVFMAPELLQTFIPAQQRITTKADIFSLGATMLEIATGINLPQNGVMWQKLRQAGEGVIRFSPSANRSAQLEQLISMMMESNPEKRPSTDELLLHPQMQTILNSVRDSSIPSTTAQKQPHPNKRRLNPLSKLNLEASPILQKFKNPPSCRSDNAPHMLNEMILISPRILLSAQKHQYQERYQNNKKSEQLHKRPHIQVYEALGNNDDGYTCRNKRRRKSSIDSCQHSSSQGSGHKAGRKGCYKSIQFEESDELDEDGMPLCLRTVGKSASFQDENEITALPNIPYPSSQNFGLNNSQVEHQQSTTHSSKMIFDQNHLWRPDLVQETKPFPTFSSGKESSFKSAKKLMFNTEDNNNHTPTKRGKISHLNAEEDFQINNFSPNDEGQVAQLHIFAHHGINKDQSITKMDIVDEAMTEDDGEESCTPMSMMDSQNFDQPNKTQYFGGFSLLAPSSKLHKQQSQRSMFKVPSSQRQQQIQPNFSSQTFGVKNQDSSQAQRLIQDTINNLNIPSTLRLEHQFSFNDKSQHGSSSSGIIQRNIWNANFGSSSFFGKNCGSNNFNEEHSGSQSDLSTPKLQRNQSSTSGIDGCGGPGGAINSLNGSVVNSNAPGFQMRGSNASVFDHRQSALTFFEPRISNATSSFLETQQRGSSTSGTETANFAFNQYKLNYQRSSNTSSDLVHGTTTTDPQLSGSQNQQNNQFYKLKASPRVLNLANANQAPLQMPLSGKIMTEQYFQNSIQTGTGEFQIIEEQDQDNSDMIVCSEELQLPHSIAYNQKNQNLHAQNSFGDVKRNLFQI